MEELREKIPFHCIIVGPTRGKTQYLIEKLRGPFKVLFDFIVLVCPTYAYNKTYGFGKGDKRFIVAVKMRLTNCLITQVPCSQVQTR